MFWMTIIPATVTFIYCVAGCFDILPPISEELVVNGLLAVVTGLTTLGVLVDPTTKGIGDSELAMTYTEPREDDLAEEGLEE